MHALSTLARLGIGGLLLDPRAFRAQRDDPGAFQRGLFLVALVGLLVGLASWIGDLGEYLTQPDPEAVRSTLYDGLTAMPWFRQVAEEVPGFSTSFEQAFAQQAGLFQTNPLLGLGGVALAPILALLSWLIVGTIVHIAARAFGGTASYGQTLACTALAAGANLLGLVQVVPYAQVAGATLLGLIVTYVAVREAHGLPSWRAFWAVTIGPLLLTALLAGLGCCAVIALVSTLSSAQGAAL